MPAITPPETSPLDAPEPVALHQVDIEALHQLVTDWLVLQGLGELNWEVDATRVTRVDETAYMWLFRLTTPTYAPVVFRYTNVQNNAVWEMPAAAVPLPAVVLVQ